MSFNDCWWASPNAPLAINAVYFAPAIGSVAAAAANTATIRTLLKQGGEIHLVGFGVAYISATLVIGPNTTLVIADTLTIRQAPGTNGSLLRNAASYATPVSVVPPVANTWTISAMSASTSMTVTGNLTGAPAIGQRLTGTGATATAHITAGAGSSWTVSPAQTITGGTTITGFALSRDLTITWTAHGRSVGDSVSLSNPAFVGVYNSYAPVGQTAYLGVFPVIAVIDANTLTVRLRSTPTAACSFPLYAVVADKNIRVIGGTWDYDGANNPGPNTSASMALVFNAVDGVYIDTQATNALKYCLMLSGVRRAYVQRLRVPTTFSDGIKIYGPCFDSYIDELIGLVGDDLLSVQPKEQNGYLMYPLSEGDVIGLTIRSIKFENTTASGSAFTVYCHVAYQADEIKVIGEIVGTDNSPGPAVFIQPNQDIAGTTTFGKIELGGVAINGSTPVHLFGTSSYLVSGERLDVEFRNTHVNYPNNDYPLLNSNGYFSVNTLILSGYVKDVSYASTFAMQIYCNVRNLVVKDFYFNCPNANIFMALGAGSGTIRADHVLFSGGYFASNVFQSVPGTTFTNVPDVILRDCVIDGAYGVYNGTALNVTLIGVEFTSVSSYGPIHVGGNFALTVKSVGCRFLGGYWINLTSANTGVVNIQSYEMQVDISNAAIARATGNYAWNTNSTLGTLGAVGPVVCQGNVANSWRLLGDTTKQY